MDFARWGGAMDCPECGEGYSMTVGPIVHGEHVKRKRYCAACKIDWHTVEIAAKEHARLKRAQAARRQFAQMLEER